MGEFTDNSPMVADRFDTSTYWGRLRDFQSRMNILMMFLSKDQIDESARFTKLARAGNWSQIHKEGVTAEELQRRVIIYKTCVHPQTEDHIHPLCRIAAFCPVNIPICAGMLLAPPTLANSIIWQWVNQTYNAAFNFLHSNRTKDTSKTEQTFMNQYGDIVKGYVGATVVSVSLAVGFNQALRRAQLSPGVRATLQGIVPFSAVACANVSNVALMRQGELQKGIPIFGPDGEKLGMSKTAGYWAVGHTAISRVALSAPVLILPPPILAVCYKAKLLKSSAVLRVMSELGVLYGCLYFGLPAAVALFPQTATLPVEKLEAEYHNLKTVKGEKITQVVYNRGV